jgi:hypothetical protein
MSEKEIGILNSFTFWFKISSGLLVCVGMLISYIYFSTMGRIENAIIVNNERIIKMDRELYGVKRDVDSLLKNTKWRD